MQSGKNAMEGVKEKTADMGAAARSGMEKTKATVEGQVDKMRAHNPAEKEMARERKEEKKDEAELNKQAAYEHNAAKRDHHAAADATTGHPATHYTTNRYY